MSSTKRDLSPEQKRIVGRRRLLKLADFLKKLPANRFDYTSWVGLDWQGKQDLSCGTTGCALGWATTMPEFRRLGLRLHVVGKTCDTDLDTGESFTSETYLVGMVGLKGKNDGPFQAASEIFKISLEHAQFLFSPWFSIDDPRPKEKLPPGHYGYLTSPGARAKPKDVAKHIREYVKIFLQKPKKTARA